MKIEAHRKILLLAILLALLSPLPANAAFGDGSFSEFKLTSDTPVPRAQFGHSVAVSGDTIVVGDHIQSAVYVFEYDGSDWRQVATLTTYFGWFGYSVAISGDTIAVGAPFDSYPAGAAYVFNREGGTWNTVPETILTASNSAIFFGWSLAFEGDTLLVGAPMVDSVYVVNRVVDPNDGTTSWTERAESPLTGKSGDRFGWSVAVSGSKLVVGAPRDESTAGSAYVFDYVFDFDEEAWKWLETKKLTASDKAERDDFGFSVAIHNDTVVVGARKDSTFEEGPGAAYVFKIDGDIWSQEDKLTASASSDYDDEFGYSVAIKDSTLLVGAPNDTDAEGTITGTAYLFKYNGSNWVKDPDPVQPTTEPGLQEGDQFGWSVAIDGSTIAVGSPPNPNVDSAPKAGAAYVFTPNEAPVSEVYSTLGRSRHRFFPAWEIFEFTAAPGKATLIFEADPNGSNNHGKGVSVFVKDRIRGERFFMKKRWALGAPMEMDLPADGKYRVFVFGHPWYFRSKGFRGDYVLKLKVEGTCAELKKVVRRKKCK